jgi:hypothetical protein
MISRGEMVLNPHQQRNIRALAGFDVFAGAGIPNYPNPSASPKLAGGGLAGAGLGSPQIIVQPNFTRVRSKGCSTIGRKCGYISRRRRSSSCVKVDHKGDDSDKTLMGRVLTSTMDQVLAGDVRDIDWTIELTFPDATIFKYATSPMSFSRGDFHKRPRKCQRDPSDARRGCRSRDDRNSKTRIASSVSTLLLTGENGETAKLSSAACITK